MKKIHHIFIIITLAVMGGTALVMSGYYPIAMIGMRPVFYRTWLSLQRGTSHYLETQANREGNNLDLSLAQHAELLYAIKTDALTLLIEDAIISSNGNELMEDFDAAARSKGKEATKDVKDFAKSVEFMYGLSRKEFERMILLPQARRDVITGHLKERNQTFDEWLRDVKKSAHIRLLFVPYEWNGEQVR